MNSKYLSVFCLFFFVVFHQINAQRGFSQEIGVIFGPTAVESDYGARNDLSTRFGNTGYGIGIVHFLNFSYTSECNCYNPTTYFNDHFKLRSELSYSKADLQHYGRWIEGRKTYNNINGVLVSGKDQLAAMRGSTTLTNLGVQLEFYPYSIREFDQTLGSLAPFFSFGVQYTFYNAKVESLDGILGNPIVTFPKYLPSTDGRPYSFSSESKSIFTAVTSVGTRYKLTKLSDLMIDFRMQYYFSDWIDGLKPNPEIYKENKYNDWLLWLNVGYIHYF